MEVVLDEHVILWK